MFIYIHIFSNLKFRCSLSWKFNLHLLFYFRCFFPRFDVFTRQPKKFNSWLLYPHSPKGEGDILFYLCPSVQDIFRRIFLSNCWWQKSDIWSQASYRYTILWVAFLDPSDSYFLFTNFVDFYTHLTYIFICTFFVAFF
jgi:hypothetical protein